MKVLNTFILAVLVLLGCSPTSKNINIKVSNSLDFARQETVEIPVSSLGIDLNSSEPPPVIYETESNVLVPFQFDDSNADGEKDKLLIAAEVDANSQKIYSIKFEDSAPETESKVFARFVPERTDDFAWENDRVAFRTYGPTAQKMIEEDIPGGTLSSGIDCWLKKVDYPIINKWYKKNASGEGSYHEDTGEGLDNFHVGISRGCGGLGVFVNEELYTSKNFTGWPIHSNGPVRTSFSLEYADWSADKVIVKETKNISLDLGSNMMKVEAEISGPDVITVGLTLHENDGEISVDTVNGLFSYWQPHGDSELGTAIVCLPEYYQGYTHFVSEEKDKSHLLVHLKVVDGAVEYYTGFGWKESGQFSTKADWEKYLDQFSKTIKSPLEVKIN